MCVFLLCPTMSMSVIHVSVTVILPGGCSSPCAVAVRSRATGPGTWIVNEANRFSYYDSDAHVVRFV